MLNEDELKDAALLVFANKQDQPGAKGAGEISEALRLGELRDRNWSIVACSAVDGRGVTEGMDWLSVSFDVLLCLVDECLVVRFETVVQNHVLTCVYRRRCSRSSRDNMELCTNTIARIASNKLRI
jgi:hypothetical protein